MSTPDLSAGALPRLTATRLRHGSRSTTRDLFGYEGQFFTVPGTFPDGLPDHIGFIAVVYAVLRTTASATVTDEFTVRDVDGYRQTLGTPGNDQDAAIRSALSALAERRRAHGRQVEHNRVQVLGLPAVPPVRIGHSTTGTCVLHVLCSCPHVEGLAAHFEHVSLAADWLDESPTGSWELCATAPTHVTIPHGGGRLTATLRDSKGTAVVEIQHSTGHREAVALAEVSDLT